MTSFAYYENEPDFSIHLGKTTCLLCRHVATSQSLTLDLHGKELGTLECSPSCVTCSIKPHEQPWMHKLCFDLLRASNKPNEPTLEDLRRFATVTKPMYKFLRRNDTDSASSREGLFSRHARPIVENTLRIELFERLPAEIQDIIYSYIGSCWYLIVLGESCRLIEELRSRHESPCKQLSLNKEVYISRIPYQGNFYISTISNEQPEPPLDGWSLECLNIPDGLNKIVVSTDHIGVRGIQFVVDGSAPPRSDGSPWYDFIDIPDSSQMLHVATEGLFVRGIRRAEDKEAQGTLPLWSCPTPPKLQPWNIYDDFGGHRLDYVNLDGEGVQGLVVCCCITTTMGLYAFSGLSKPFKEFVASMQQKANLRPTFWMYFPINDGELITAAWIRKMKGQFGAFAEPVLAIQTTLGRTATFGPYHRGSYHQTNEFFPLVKDGDGTISGFTHDGLDMQKAEASHFGVTCRESEDATLTSLKPAPPPAEIEGYTSPVPYSNGAGLDWYMTTATLSGLSRVRVCRDLDMPRHTCIGLLLYYEDGHVESLGQIRWDQDVSREVSMPIRIRRCKVDGNTFLVEVQGIDLTGGEGETDGGLDEELAEGWLDVPRTGTMVWRFHSWWKIISVYNDASLRSRSMVPTSYLNSTS
ncbi:hypothetical protein MGYG_05055 [Nannizzia gypsea CBS 118893]|uniref:Uncharacterized protein n=1 Tax=Arthroderma gypseum (strain ATCC MYA-4604 / CBS 118893) TaxID=535722 RepID=E4UY89_ARTGP|nr:hypothetical protein MGYG_05055 [Nannizzia gypsea CBS 118893]EFR02052.1 hypothetical protein MGYG_05055 [Nannizzia gypsea CBS 118893]